MNKKFGYTATHNISENSNLNMLYISDDIQQPIQIFENEKYELLMTVNKDKKATSLIYKSDHDEDIGVYLNKFKEDALKELRIASNRLQVLCGLSKTDKHHSIKTRTDLGIAIEYFNYESKRSKRLLEAESIQSYQASISIVQAYKVQDIRKVLETDKEIIDEYIDRFLSLDNLSSDPVLHLLTLSSLYEYIKETSDNHLDLRFNEIKIGIIGKERVGKKNFQDKELTFKDKFISTRNLAAHGLVDEYTTVYNLEQILEIAPPEKSTSGKRFYSFNRYNQSHVNLINRVIGEAQPIIQQYLRGKLGLNQYFYLK